MGEKIKKWMANPIWIWIIRCIAFEISIMSTIAAIVTFVYGMFENAWVILAAIPCALLSGASWGVLFGLDEL